jgi:hypothetical protein
MGRKNSVTMCAFSTWVSNDEMKWLSRQEEATPRRDFVVCDVAFKEINAGPTCIGPVVAMKQHGKGDEIRKVVSGIFLCFFDVCMCVCVRERMCACVCAFPMSKYECSMAFSSQYPAPLLSCCQCRCISGQSCWSMNVSSSRGWHQTS